MAKGNWEVFTVKYLVPKFGVENEFLPEEHAFMVSTQGGIEDAKTACLKYHSGCKIIAVLDHLASSLDDRGELNLIPLKEKSHGHTKSKKSSKK